jgi:hypothetical protein
MDKEKTKVIFRKWTDKNGGVIAFFPEIPTEDVGYFMQSYEHLGQHGSADYNKLLRYTRPAKPDEYADLKAELQGIGYNLRIVKRHTYADFQHRRRQVRECHIKAARGVQ